MARRSERPTAPPNLSAYRATVERLKGEISRTDRLAGRKYLRDFLKEYQTYERLVTEREVLDECWKSDLIFVGDYHALPSCQAFAARLLEEMARRSRKVVLAVEVFPGRHQRLLDSWLDGRISEETLLDRCRWREEWGYPWEGYRDLLLAARDLGISVAAVDTDPRRGLRGIHQRDRTVAAKLTSILQDEPGVRLVVLFGESHLASGHLPLRTRKVLHSVGMERRDVVVVQNQDSLYWRALEKGADSFEAVSLGGRRFCVFNATPLEKYEAYQQVLDRWKGAVGSGETDLQPSVYRIVDTILRFLKVDKYRLCLEEEGICLSFLCDAYPEVYGPDRMADLDTLLEELPRRRIREVRGRLRRRGACYVREINALFVARFRLADVAEEAARFVTAALSRRLYRGRHRGRRTAQRFFDAVMQEALSYLGSKVLQPTRNFLEEPAFSGALGRGRPGRAQRDGTAASLVRAVRTLPADAVAEDDIPPGLASWIEEAAPRQRRLAARALGYFLGQRLWEDTCNGVFPTRELVALFGLILAEEGDGWRAYSGLTGRVGAL